MLKKSSFKNMLIPEGKSPFLPYFQLVLLKIAKADIYNVETWSKQSSTNLLQIN